MDILTDTHCHLDMEAFAKDRGEVLDRAWDAGLIRILLPGIDLDSSSNVAGIAASHRHLFAAVGVHPNNAMTWEPGSADKLKKIARQGKVVAIGEIGLDYYREHAPKNIQHKILLAQLELASSLDLPVILHNRNATDDLLDILTDWQTNLVKSGTKIAAHPGVLHSYSGDYGQAVRAMDLGFFIGLTGPVTFKNAPELQELVARLPLESLLIETDAPFLSPHPFRGKRNEPAYVRLVAEKIGELHKSTAAEVGRLTAANAEKLFGW